MTFLFLDRFLEKANKEKSNDLSNFLYFATFVGGWLLQYYPVLPKIISFFNSLLDYKTKDSVIANEALRRFGNQMWYLTEEFVLLCLFSKNVKDSTKLAMAKNC